MDHTYYSYEKQLSRVHVKICSNATNRARRKVLVYIPGNILGVEEGDARVNAYYRFASGYMQVARRVCYRPGLVLKRCMYA